jgi:hypothetical protein
VRGESLRIGPVLLLDLAAQAAACNGAAVAAPTRARGTPIQHALPACWPGAESGR